MKNYRKPRVRKKNQEDTKTEGKTNLQRRSQTQSVEQTRGFIPGVKGPRTPPKNKRRPGPTQHQQEQEEMDTEQEVERTNGLKKTYTMHLPVEVVDLSGKAKASSSALEGRKTQQLEEH